MKQSEKSILNDTLVDLWTIPRSMWWRNNSGQAWQGKPVDFYPGTRIPVPAGVVVLVDARPVKFGLKGSGDILGSMIVRNPICGCEHGLPVAVEVKQATGRQEESQKRFEVAWGKAGGRYILGRSVEEILTPLERLIQNG